MIASLVRKICLVIIVNLAICPQGISEDSFSEFSSLSKRESKSIRSYLLPLDHPMKPVLDTIFLKSRAIQDQNTFALAGFVTHYIQGRSYIRVASHPELPGYLVKVYLDNVLSTRKGKSDLYWFKKRCEGAKAISRVIKKAKIKNFNVAKKWIYLLPEYPAPPKSPEYLRKNVLLLVKDMELVSSEDSYHAWRTFITPNHLDELYLIIKFGGGSSYRPDNIPYTRSGKFAFIDTEYPNQVPDFKSIRPFLSPKMQKYWDKLVQNGGS